MQRLKGRSSELQEALTGEVATVRRLKDHQEQSLGRPCPSCAEERLQRNELQAEGHQLRTELLEFEAVKRQLQRMRSNNERLRDDLVQDMKNILVQHVGDESGTTKKKVAQFIGVVGFCAIRIHQGGIVKACLKRRSHVLLEVHG